MCVREGFFDDGQSQMSRESCAWVRATFQAPAFCSTGQAATLSLPLFLLLLLALVHVTLSLQPFLALFLLAGFADLPVFFRNELRILGQLDAIHQQGDRWPSVFRDTQLFLLPAGNLD